MTRRDVLAEAVSPLRSRGGAQRCSVCCVTLVSSQLVQRLKEIKMLSAGAGEPRGVVSPQALSADPVLEDLAQAKVNPFVLTGNKLFPPQQR